MSVMYELGTRVVAMQTATMQAVAVPIASTPLAAEAKAASEPTEVVLRVLAQLDFLFAEFVQFLRDVFLFGVADVPLLLLWILFGGAFFTLRMGFINIRGLKHAFDVAFGKYDDDDEDGEVSHFQALATSLSGTVGLGNIAGAAIAVQLGGPGAVVWMSLSAVLGMSSKFVECTLAQKFRQVRADGTVAGGPMQYLSEGLATLSKPRLGQVLAVAFAVLCIGSTLSAGNMFQANQSGAALARAVPWFGDHLWVYAVTLSSAIGLVIVGGLDRIGAVTSSLMPAVVVLYTAGCLWILAVNIDQIPTALQAIYTGAFTPNAVSGGILGALVQGLRRGMFSNGAGLGATAIAHAATRTKEPIREGILASLEPAVDTVIICNLTALAITVTGVYKSGAIDADGIELATAAFGQVVGWFPYVLATAVCLFAFSTMISWSYYGEQAWIYLFGEDGTIAYKSLFIVSAFSGALIELTTVLDLSDVLLLGMALPNLVGCFLLSNGVAADLKSYWVRMQEEKEQQAVVPAVEQEYSGSSRG